MLTVEERFWQRVALTDECWPWLGAKNKNGYGTFSPTKELSKTLAHRFAWELYRGPIPEGMLVCHTCDNPECTNPKHLFLGTPQDNMDDKVRKGRWRGNPVRINLEVHLEGVLTLRSQGKTLSAIAKDFDCDRNVVKKLLEKHGVYTSLITGPSRLVEPHIDSIILRRDAGEALSSIAASFGCDKGVIRRLLDKRGEYAPVKPGPRTPHNVRTEALRAQLPEILARYKSGEAINSLAKSLGSNHRTIAKIIRTASIPS